jgi:phosphoglycerate dehydrogenase-like enzyme
VRVVLHYAAGPDLAARLAALEALEVEVCPEADEARFGTLMAEAEVLWHVLKPVTAAVVAAAPRLRLVQKIGGALTPSTSRRRGRAGSRCATCPAPTHPRWPNWRCC